MSQLIKSLLYAFLSLLFLSGCSEQAQQETNIQPVNNTPTADIVLTNGYVYTIDNDKSVKQAVAIKDEIIIYVGDEQDVQKFIGDSTKIEDLKGRMLMPGLHDMHIHAAGIVELDMCDFKGQPYSLEDMVPFLQDCLQRYQIEKDEWLIVLQWPFSYGNQPSERLPTMRAALDAVSVKHPIMMFGDDGHHAAANSLALAGAKNREGKVVGINKTTLSDVFAEYKEMIGVDESGEPDGNISENARKLVRETFNKDIQGLWEGPEAIMPGVNAKLAASGVTSIQDTWVDKNLEKYYHWLADSGEMTFRLRTALFEAAEDTHSDSGLEQISMHVEHFKQTRDKLQNFKYVQANGVKLFADAVLEGNPYAQPPSLPVAAVLDGFKQPIFSLDPNSDQLDVVGYVDQDSKTCQQVHADPGSYEDARDVNAFLDKHGYHPAQCQKAGGVLEHSEAYIKEYVRQMTEAGFHVHIHALSDKGIRVAMDAFAAVKSMADEQGLTQSITHVQLAHPDDVKRIGELGVYVAFTYVWVFPTVEYDMTVIPFIDKVNGIADLYNPEHYYMQNAYPVNSVQEAGGILTWGSDAPVGSRDPLAFPSMQAAVTREADGQVLNPEQRISIHDVIAAYTINGARLMGHDNKLGSIEVGKTADLIVLNQNVVELAEQGKADSINETLVDMTIFDGKIIYQRH
ncbi:MAG: amidohydrolase family protein [Gammaproteobacteria bacterium]|nr:amidohydrolase family protein [Gammaproteobacteria bacterium]